MGNCTSSWKQLQQEQQQPVAPPFIHEEQQPVAPPVIHFTLVLPSGLSIEAAMPDSEPVSVLPKVVVDGAPHTDPLELGDVLGIWLGDGPDTVDSAAGPSH